MQKEIGETTTTLPDKSERILVEEPALANNKLAISSSRKSFAQAKLVEPINTASLYQNCQPEATKFKRETHVPFRLYVQLDTSCSPSFSWTKYHCTDLVSLRRVNT
jgi:hypothetical protein